MAQQIVKPLSRIIVLLVGLVGMLGIVPHAQAQQAEQVSNSAAFLFAYTPKAGMQSLFEEGYRRHLDWHREKGDPLVWYAWTVIAGERTGLFIDGTVGIPFSAFDQRVDMSGDRADFAQTTAPFADVAFRKAYRLRRDLSTGTPLEDRQPSVTVQVVHYVLRAGREAQFEEVLRAVRAAHEQGEAAPVYTWYEVVVGSQHPGYLLMVARDAWAAYGEASASVPAVIRRHYEAEEADRLLDAWSAAVVRVESEVWRYRRDLSYFPER